MCSLNVLLLIPGSHSLPFLTMQDTCQGSRDSLTTRITTDYSIVTWHGPSSILETNKKLLFCQWGLNSSWNSCHVVYLHGIKPRAFLQVPIILISMALTLPIKLLPKWQSISLSLFNLSQRLFIIPLDLS